MKRRQVDIDMKPYFEDAERILAASQMHPVMAEAIIQFARIGAGTYDTRDRSIRATQRADVDGELLSTRQAARRLGVSEKQVYRLLARGQLRSYGIGRRHHFRLAELDTLIDRSSNAARETHRARRAFEDRNAA